MCKCELEGWVGRIAEGSCFDVVWNGAVARGGKKVANAGADVFSHGAVVSPASFQQDGVGVGVVACAVGGPACSAAVGTYAKVEIAAWGSKALKTVFSQLA